jgi:hypothetical protein
VRLFGRRSRGPEVPDWAAPIFDADEYEHFLAVVSADLGRRGADFELGADGEITFGDDVHAYLTNLGQVCRQKPREEWPDAVAEHFDAVAESGSLPSPDDLTGDDARARLRARLTSGDYGVESPPIVDRPLAPGLAVALALDFPTTIGFARPEDVTRWGVPEDELFDIAIAAVRELDEPPDIDRLETSSGDSDLFAISGNSFYTTSGIFHLDEWVGPLPEHGALFGVPHRHVLLAHPITGIGVLDVFPTLATMTAGMFQEGPGSISPELYWLNADGRIVHIPQVKTQDGVSVMPPEEFVALLNVLAEEDAG